MKTRREFIVSFFSRFSDRRVWGAAAGFSLLLYLSAWPLFFHGLILPRMDPRGRGLQVELHDGPKREGKPVPSSISQGEPLILDKPDSSLLAYGLWEVPKPGRYRLQLECDDYGSLSLDGRDLIRLQGVNAHNRGETEVTLKAGRHLLFLRLFNGPGRGWMKWNAAVASDGRWQPEEMNLIRLNGQGLTFWLRIIKGMQGFSQGLFLFAVAMLLLSAFFPSGHKDREPFGREGDTQRRSYLRSPAAGYGLPLLLFMVYLYQLLNDPHPFPLKYGVVLLLIPTILLILWRRPLWQVYSLLFLALILNIIAFTQIISQGPQDPSSTRDEAVEAAAQALLEGENPWDRDVGAPITAGPTGILLAVPFLLLFHNLNWLAFFFWTALALTLLRFDLERRNHSFPLMALILLLGLFGIEHTLYWSLEELYFPYLLFLPAYGAAFSKRFFFIGVMTALVLLSRSSYFFVVLGFYLWLFLHFPIGKKSLVKLGSGWILGLVLLLLPFWVVGGEHFWKNNFFHAALSISGAPWPDHNIFFRFLNRLSVLGGPSTLRFIKLGLFVFFLFPLSFGLQRLRIPHPFWHLAFSALLAHTLVWVPTRLSMDYLLMFILPAMLAISDTPHHHPVEEG